MVKSAFFWTDEQAERAKAMWLAGFTGSQIAKDIFGDAKAYRSAVMGKIKRMGLSEKDRAPKIFPHKLRMEARKARREKREQAKKEPKPPRLPRIVPLALAMAEQAQLTCEALPMVEKANVITLPGEACKWPLGDPLAPGFHFCARPVARHMRDGHEKVLPYCATHAAVGYRAAT